MIRERDKRLEYKKKEALKKHRLAALEKAKTEGPDLSDINVEKRAELAANAQALSENKNELTEQISAKIKDASKNFQEGLTSLFEEAKKTSAEESNKLAVAAAAFKENPSLDNASKLVDVIQGNIVLDAAVSTIPVLGEAYDVLVMANDLKKGDYGSAAISLAAMTLPGITASQAKKIVKVFQKSEIGASIQNGIGYAVDSIWGIFGKKRTPGDVAVAKGPDPGTPNCPGGNCKVMKCFEVGTLVSTPEGKRKIEELRVGDLVYAYDFKAERFVPRKVTHLIRGFTKTWIDIHVNGEIIRATPGASFRSTQK